MSAPSESYDEDDVRDARDLPHSQDRWGERELAASGVPLVPVAELPERLSRSLRRLARACRAAGMPIESTQHVALSLVLEAEDRPAVLAVVAEAYQEVRR